MTNKELAQLAQISESTVSRILATKGAVASTSTLAAICDALGVSAETAQYEVVERSATKDEVYEARIDDLKRTIAQKETWNKRLFIVCLCLTAFVLALFAIDVLNPAVGWFRG